MNSVDEAKLIRALFKLLIKQKKYKFPKPRARLDAPALHGVYVIRNASGCVKHVGRSVRGKHGLAQRLRNHLQSQSSFVVSHLEGNGMTLREGYTFQYLEVADPRVRALLEHLAVGELCPKHLGVGA